MRIEVVEAPTLGEGWLAVSRAILEQGALLTVTVAHPAPDDPTIERLGDPQWLAWMHENFFVRKDVAELGNLVELARLQEHVAGELVVHAKSAHVYEPEWSLMASIAGVGEPIA